MLPAKNNKYMFSRRIVFQALTYRHQDAVKCKLVNRKIYPKPLGEAMQIIHHRLQ